jgi:hypothetical protein
MMKKIPCVIFMVFLGLGLAEYVAQTAKGGKTKPPAAHPSPEAVASPAQPEGDFNYKYEMRGRRDPFRPLDIVSSFLTTQAPIVRLPGLKGQMISEIKLVGIVQSSSGMLAMSQGFKNRTYFLHPNDVLYDGKVLEIHKDAVIFSQTLKDTEGKIMTQQVVKKLQPTRGEGK